ncbi:MAG: class I SAM-dependent methyltransferase [Ferruginibacter sp.]|nr:class I SAM-dependent methyltransferase [Ferruginibacter sp.]
MKIFPYIQYFFYLGLNWNWRIAFHILWHEVKGEQKYGIHTTGSDELKKTAATGVDISHATVYMPASYLLLEQIFTKLPCNDRKHFLDIGCGKGRALCVAAHNGFQKVTGIEFSNEFCANAEENLRHTKKIFPSLDYSVIHKDAVTVDIPGDVDCIFFFNPFDQFMMRRVAKHIQESYKKNPRSIYIVYLNPLYKKELIQIGFKEIYYTKKMKYMEAMILHAPGP